MENLFHFFFYTVSRLVCSVVRLSGLFSALQKEAVCFSETFRFHLSNYTASRPRRLYCDSHNVIFNSILSANNLYNPFFTNILHKTSLCVYLYIVGPVFPVYRLPKFCLQTLGRIPRMHLSIPENTEQGTYMHRNGFKSTISLYQQQEIHKLLWPHWDSNQPFNLQVSLNFLLDPVLQQIPFHFTFTYTGSPFTLIYRPLYFVYFRPFVRIRPSVDLLQLPSAVFAWRSRVTVHAADLVLFVSLNRVAILLNCTRHLRLFGMPVVCQTFVKASANYFAGANGDFLQ